jgi:hypothetical protein
MNKIIVYTIIAILLGTVTMTTPLVMLEQKHNIPTGAEDTITEQENTTTDIEPNDQEYERSEMLATPEAANEPTDEPSYTNKEPEDIEEKPLDPQISDSKLILTDATLGLSSIGLMIIPSFLCALGVFEYLRRRTK